MWRAANCRPAIFVVFAVNAKAVHERFTRDSIQLPAREFY